MTDDVIERVGRRVLAWTGYEGVQEKIAQDLLSALKPGDVLPGGLVVVPAEPTKEMVAAGDNALDDATDSGIDSRAGGYYTSVMSDAPAQIYAAMLAAAKEVG